MSSISNDKKTALCIAGIVLLMIGAVLALTEGRITKIERQQSPTYMTSA